MKFRFLFLFFMVNIFNTYCQFDDLYFDSSRDFIKNTVKIPYRFDNDNSKYITHFPSIMRFHNPLFFNNFYDLDYWWNFNNFYSYPNYSMGNWYNPWRSNVVIFNTNTSVTYTPKTFISRKSGSVSSSVNGRTAPPRKPIIPKKEESQPITRNYTSNNNTIKSYNNTNKNYSIRNNNVSQRVRQESINQKQ